MEKFGGLVAILALLFSCLALQQLAMGKGNDISCGSVTADLMPCLGFITDKDTAPPANCCSGAKKVADMAKTQPDRQAVCECIKSAVKPVSNIDYARISEIPKSCNLDVTLPPMQNNTDCSTIQFVTMSLY